MKRIRILGLLCVLALGTTACAQVEPPIIVDMEDVATSIFGGNEETSVAEKKEASEEASEVDEKNAVEKNTDGTFGFGELAGERFVMSTGAGAHTELIVDKSGKFQGVYHGYDMTEKGKEYEGTTYYSEFQGEFAKLKKLDSTTYSLELKSMKYPLGETKRTVDGMRYVYTKALGFMEGKEFLLYLPGTKVSELPNEFKQCVDSSLLKKEEISFYGLFNKKEGKGFYSIAVVAPLAQAEEILNDAKATVQELKLQRAKATTQQDVNMLAYEIYQEWDIALNHVWSIIENTLDEKTYAKVHKEEENWIASKRAMKKRLNQKFADMALADYAVYTEAAEMTEERAYELLEYLK